MKIAEIMTEAVIPIWGRKGGRMARRYRCTAGVRKGRIVGSPATCSKPKNVQKSLAMKKNISRRGSQMKLKTGRTKRATISRRVKKLNVTHARSKSPKFYKRKPIK